MTIISDPSVQEVFDHYPSNVKTKMLRLRQLVFACAAELDGIDEVEETLKWGEPSYLTKHGSTLRMDWKEKQPDQYALYFSCTSQLVPTFKEVFGNIFRYEGNRAIAFGLEQSLPEEEVKDCIKAALRYHRVKKLPFLGITS